MSNDYITRLHKEIRKSLREVTLFDGMPKRKYYHSNNFFLNLKIAKQLRIPVDQIHHHMNERRRENVEHKVY